MKNFNKKCKLEDNIKLLKNGDVVEIKIGHSIETDIPEHFVYDNKKGSFKLTKAIVTIDNKLSYLTGKYIVIHVANTGGFTGPGVREVYSHGYQITCESEDCKHIIRFFQTGSFNNLIADIKPIGRATKKWIIE